MTAASRGMWRASRSTIGSMRTATTTAAAAHDNGRWAATNTRCATTAATNTSTPTTADRAVMRTTRCSVGRWPGCTEAYRTGVADEVTAEQGSGPPSGARDRRDPSDGRVLVDIDPWSFVALVLAAAVALAMFAISDRAGDVLTGIGVGVLLGLALTPVVNAAQRRWDTTRGTAVVIVGTALTLGVAVIVLLVAPAAIRQSREFSDELPTTVREFYS